MRDIKVTRREGRNEHAVMQLMIYSRFNVCSCIETLHSSVNIQRPFYPPSLIWCWLVHLATWTMPISYAPSGSSLPYVRFLFDFCSFFFHIWWWRRLTNDFLIGRDLRSSFSWLCWCAWESRGTVMDSTKLQKLLSIWWNGSSPMVRFCCLGSAAFTRPICL